MAPSAKSGVITPSRRSLSTNGRLKDEISLCDALLSDDDDDVGCFLSVVECPGQLSVDGENWDIVTAAFGTSPATSRTWKDAVHSCQAVQLQSAPQCACNFNCCDNGASSFGDEVRKLHDSGGLFTPCDEVASHILSDGVDEQLSPPRDFDDGVVGPQLASTFSGPVPRLQKDTPPHEAVLESSNSLCNSDASFDDDITVLHQQTSVMVKPWAPVARGVSACSSGEATHICDILGVGEDARTCEDAAPWSANPDDFSPLSVNPTDGLNTSFISDSEVPSSMHHGASEMAKLVVAANGTMFFLAPAAHARQTTHSGSREDQVSFCGLLPTPPIYDDNAMESIGGMVNIVGTAQPSLRSQHAVPNPNASPPALRDRHRVDLLLSLNRELAQSAQSTVGAGRSHKKKRAPKLKQPTAKKQKGAPPVKRPPKQPTAKKQKGAPPVKKPPTAKQQKQVKLRIARENVIRKMNESELRQAQLLARSTRENDVLQMGLEELNGERRVAKASQTLTVEKLRLHRSWAFKKARKNWWTECPINQIMSEVGKNKLKVKGRFAAPTAASTPSPVAPLAQGAPTPSPVAPRQCASTGYESDSTSSS